MLDPPISRFMTASPQVTSPQTTLADAHRAMRRLDIRHLPVLRDAQIVGIVAARDLAVCQAVPHFDPGRVTVEEIMVKDVLVAPLQATLREVADQMRERRCGSAVIMDHGRVVGIFTTTDALRALTEIIYRECET